MTRNTAITYEEVVEAIKKIQSKGEAPTILRVKDELGNRGSTTVISKFVKQYKEGGVPAPASTSDQEPRPSRAHRPPRAPQEESKSLNHEPLPTPVLNAVPKESSVQPQASVSLPPPTSVILPSVDSEQQQGAQNSHQQPHQATNHQPNHQPNHQRRYQEGGQRRQNNFEGGGNNNSNNPQRPRHNNKPQGQRFDNRNSNQDRNQRRSYQQPYPTVVDGPAVSYPQDPYAAFEQEVIVSENLETMSENQLATKIRKLESMLNKEQARTEAAEKMAAEAKQYAEAIKAQAGLRVADVKQAMETLIQQLRMEADAIKRAATEDLKYYREQLDKANALISK